MAIFQNIHYQGGHPMYPDGKEPKARYAESSDYGQKEEKDLRDSKAISAAHSAKKLGEQRNQSEGARNLSNQAHALSMRAVDPHSDRVAGDAHHDAAKIHLNEGNSDLADAHFTAAKAHFKAARGGKDLPKKARTQESYL